MGKYSEDIVNRDDLYTRGHSGSSLVFELYKKGKDGKTENLIARGTGLSWGENYQNFPVQEWGKDSVSEVVIGAMQLGQLQFSSVLFFKLKDKMPTFKNIREFRELTAKVFLAEDLADPDAVCLRGKVVDYFVGVYITGQSENWNSQSLALKNGNMVFRQRFSPEEYYKEIAKES
ncbi:MAG TPA: hypothetical protein VHO03_16970 [Ignavibacteriales bacterium]|nr:hypothetical protein [Ignavibacteriales bacterium]